MKILEMRKMKLSSKINEVVATLLRLREQGIFIIPNEDRTKISARGLTDALTESDKQFITINKALIISIIGNGLNFDMPHIPIRRIEKTGSYLLSSSQRRLWIISQITNADVAYNMPGAYVFSGALDSMALSRSFLSLLERHEILRTVFRGDDEGNVLQVVVELDFLGLSLVESDHRGSGRDAVDGLIELDFGTSFDLSSGPLLRAHLYRTGDDEWVFTYVMHHIISDGWSMGILVRELLDLYNGEVTGIPADLPVLGIQYRDYAAWEQSNLSGDVYAGHRDYWLDQLSGDLPVLDLWSDRPRPAVKTYTGGVVHCILDRELSDSLRSLCHQSGSTLFMGLLSVVNILLYRYSGQDDIIVGTPMAGREHPDLEGQIGFYVNTLALRTRLSGSKSFREVLGDVRGVCLDAYEHQAYPFDKLVEELGLQRDMSRNPLFDVAVVLQNTDSPAGSGIPGITVSAYQAGQTTISKFDLTFTFFEVDGGIALNIEYNSDLYDIISIERMSGHFCLLLGQLLTSPDGAVGEVDYIGQAERDVLLGEFNATSTAYPSEQTIVDLFEEQVSRFPANKAVVFGEEYFSYSELNRRIDRLASVLYHKCSSKRKLIPVFIEKGIDMLVSVLAVLKFGAGYVPIDPEEPIERIKLILNQIECDMIITSKSFKKRLPEGHWELIDPEFIGELQLKDDFITIDKPKPEDIAYLIYTSGSTGIPKGVMIQHSALANFLFAMNRVMPLDGGDHLLAMTTLSFDISILELLWTICNGVPITIKENKLDLPKLDVANNKYLDFSLFYFAAQTDKIKDKYSFIKKSAVFADENEFKSVWLPERHFNPFGGIFPNPAILASAISMITNQIQIRAGSVVLPLHDTIRVVEEWSQVDNLSNGRIGLSFAYGWHPDDFVLFPENYYTRKEIFFQQIDILSTLWNGDKITRRNGAGMDVQVEVFPKPIQDKLPMWITTTGNPKTFEAAGKLGANVLTHLLGQDIIELEKNISIYRNSLIQNGFSVDDAKVTIMLHTFVGEDLKKIKSEVHKPFLQYLKASVNLLSKMSEEFSEQEMNKESIEGTLEIFFERYWQTNTLFGTVESCTELLNSLKKIGVTEIACLVDFGVDEEKAFKNLTFLSLLKKRFQKRDLDGITGAANINSIQLTPSYLRLMLSDDDSLLFLKSLKHIIVGGERLTPELADRVLKLNGPILYNMYGPTETTIWSSYKHITRADKITIGKPISNTRFYILDESGNLCPIGVAGELYIGGAGLSAGYFKDEALTSDKFVNNKFSTVADRIYRTGDMAKWLLNGEVEILGRKDDQVKVNGHRVELGEIENLLNSFSDIESAVVLQRLPGEVDQVIAYISTDLPLSLSELRKFLTTRLPFAMLPNHYYQVENIPLFKSGKINRKVLPELSRVDLQNNVIVSEPRNRLESIVRDIWVDLLKKNNINITDNFFEIGGNSLHAIRLISKINKEFDVTLAPSILFQIPTIENVSAEILRLIPDGGNLTADTNDLETFSI
ncbi:MupA/Atu3671 family FMN-dependent luciferase-like monooxygenase [Pedobacter roseus]|uniref:LLM class flavin-dependent oxidoreductase n=1 Tax=Pedobacter roseus TaxID=336820 RepID=A0A7G9QKQ6_9SPHI|nr:MupA/Atu3671 family FMN-dependent luciferase-like monooxygenase [Pedobacter roseus]QNN43931.1 LLM class flavin-dependent oxidoreductase [Pedobacter roseus]